MSANREVERNVRWFQVGKQIQENSGKTNLKRVSLELGQQNFFRTNVHHISIEYRWQITVDYLWRCWLCVSSILDMISTNEETIFTSLQLFVFVLSVDLAVSTAHQALFTHASQVCFAASRIFVHSKIHDQFVAKSVELARKRIVGNPFDPKTDQGPQVYYFHWSRISLIYFIDQWCSIPKSSRLYSFG